MPLSPAGEALRNQAIALAVAGAWGEVCALLAAQEGAARAQPELVALHAEALLRTGRARAACDWLEPALDALRHSGDRVQLRRAWNLLGAARFELGDLDDAEAAWEVALAIGHQHGDYLLVARATNNLGAIENIRGRHEMALGLYQLAIPAYQRLGNQLGLSMSYHNMALSYRDLGALDRAEECERLATEFAREAADDRALAMAQLGRAELLLRRGDPAFAEASARRVAGTFARLPDPVRQSDALRVVGVSASALGKLAEARQALDEAVHLARAHGGALNEAEALRARAELRVACHELPAGRADAAEAARIFARLNASRELESLGQWLDSLGHLPPGE
jgi:tetratricopeptide (TPR) repeat protein